MAFATVVVLVVVVVAGHLTQSRPFPNFTCINTVNVAPPQKKPGTLLRSGFGALAFGSPATHGSRRARWPTRSVRFQWLLTRPHSPSLSRATSPRRPCKKFQNKVSPNFKLFDRQSSRTSVYFYQHRTAPGRALDGGRPLTETRTRFGGYSTACYWEPPCLQSIRSFLGEPPLE